MRGGAETEVVVDCGGCGFVGMWGRGVGGRSIGFFVRYVEKREGNGKIPLDVRVGAMEALWICSYVRCL